MVLYIPVPGGAGFLPSTVAPENGMVGMLLCFPLGAKGLFSGAFCCSFQGLGCFNEVIGFFGVSEP